MGGRSVPSQVFDSLIGEASTDSGEVAVELRISFLHERTAKPKLASVAMYTRSIDVHPGLVFLG